MEFEFQEKCTRSEKERQPNEDEKCVQITDEMQQNIIIITAEIVNFISFCFFSFIILENKYIYCELTRSSSRPDDLHNFPQTLDFIAIFL